MSVCNWCMPGLTLGGSLVIKLIATSNTTDNKRVIDLRVLVTVLIYVGISMAALECYLHTYIHMYY